MILDSELPVKSIGTFLSEAGKIKESPALIFGHPYVRVPSTKQ